jgi:sulfur carrier protein
VSSPISIVLNGEPHELDPATTIAALIEARTGSTRGSAVAVDGEVVPRSAWSEQRLRDGQSVELITAVQGG